MAMSVDAVIDPHNIYEHAGASPGLALFAEPHADTLVMYREHFQPACIEIEEAHEGREALAKALARSHDLIVTETRLRGIDGYDLCRLLRRDPATQATPIIVLTGDAFGRDVERAHRAGADSVLVKPCLPDVLLGEVQRLRRLVERSADLRSRSAALHDRVAQQMAQSHRLQQKTEQQRRALSKTFARGNTTTPSLVPPDLHCPSCDQRLEYRYSQIGGVSERHREQWDYYECASGCGAFQYRQRTRKLRRV